jgi:GDP-D-mannose 3', 5'-epimerase
MKTALVCGAGGFIGGHLVRHLKGRGYWVRAVDIKAHEYRCHGADEVLILDLRAMENCRRALAAQFPFDEVYQLAADMGGLGFIHSAETEIMRNNVMINVNMIAAAAEAQARRYFFSSSACVYRDMKLGEPEMTEGEAYPALPNNEYGWEKLYSERVVETFGRQYNMETRIARFQNCYGPYGAWKDGREKAPAALCRKVAEIPGPEGEIEVWGDGSAVRSYTYIADMIDGIDRLMHSDLKGPVNIGTPEYVSVDELAAAVARAAGKTIRLKHIDGPVGVQSRNFSNARIYSTGWSPRYPLSEGIALTYRWTEEQVMIESVTGNKESACRED